MLAALAKVAPVSTDAVLCSFYSTLPVWQLCAFVTLMITSSVSVLVVLLLSYLPRAQN